MGKVFPSEAKIREVMHEPNVVFQCVGKESKSYRLRQGASVWIGLYVNRDLGRSVKV